MAKKTTAADIVKSHLRKHASDDSRTIATYLFGRYPGQWATHNACLNMVRYYRGASGKKCRKKAKEIIPRIPKPAKRSSPSVRLTDRGRWMVTGDWHVPYHDEKALEAVFRATVDNSCDHFLLNGDALDAYQLSNWQKDPNRRHVDREIDALRDLMAAVSKLVSGRKVYKIGNHEERIANYLYQNAPQMPGMSNFDLRKELAKTPRTRR